jgi:hypothetical protein
MCQQIYEAIESKNFPFDIFGEKVLLHLFGSDPIESKTISMERFQAASKLNPRKPTYKKYYVFKMLGYLDRLQISSEPKDYMHALLRNHMKSIG